MRLPRLFDGLAFRIALLLTIALVPIGLIAVSLTYRIAADEARRNESAILALTSEAAASEESVMRAGATVAEALAAALKVVRDDAERCSGLFKAFVRENGEYSFAGFIDRNGIIVCASEGVGRDASQGPVFQQMQRKPAPRIDANRTALISGTSVIVISQPVFDVDGAFDGYVGVSLPNRRRFRTLELLSVSRPVELITFNDKGVVLSAEEVSDSVASRLPRDRNLASFVGRARTSFTGQTASGEPRVFAVVPIISNTVYALGSWPEDEVRGRLGVVWESPMLFPSLMWLVSLGVAYMAVHRLAIRNISDLRGRMQRFTSTRRFERRRKRWAVPLEFREIEGTFSELAETVTREEAELENTIHSRTVLLKEVHHRVKNNLQLIASILSMKIRKAATPEARNALKEVQLRVMSIATVHQALYTTSTVGQVQADELLDSIVSKTIEAGALPSGVVKISTDYAPVSLYPDQAVPLSLMDVRGGDQRAEICRPAGRRRTPSIRVRLTRDSSDSGVIEVENTIGTPLMQPEQMRGTGMGSNLIRAFALQIRGKVAGRRQRPRPLPRARRIPDHRVRACAGPRRPARRGRGRKSPARRARPASENGATPPIRRGLTGVSFLNSGNLPSWSRVIATLTFRSACFSVETSADGASASATCDMIRSLSDSATGFSPMPRKPPTPTIAQACPSAIWTRSISPIHSSFES